MYTAPKPENKPKVLIPSGTHKARCIGILQLGTIPTEFKGEEKWLEKVWLTFELTEETYVFKDGEEAKPFTISKEYTYSMGNKSNLRPIVEGIIGTALLDEEAYAFDLEDLLSRTCLLTVEQGKTAQGNMSSWIKSTAPLMKGMSVPPPVNKMKVMTFEKWDQEYYEKLPDFLKEKIQSSKQYEKKFKSKVTMQESMDTPPVEYPESEIDPDSIPF